MLELSRGNNQADVLFLQRLLNKRRASPRLAEDGDFGPRTEAAAVAFQRANHVRQSDGVVRAETWSKFGRIIEHDHRSRIQMYAQPNNMTCWSAAATMMTGNVMSVGAGAARTAPAGTFPNGTARDAGGLGGGIDNIETFLAHMRWRLVNSGSAPGAQVLIQALSRGPVWAAVVGASGHAIVLTSIWSDGAPDGTVIRIADPWPPGVGAFYGSAYDHNQLTLRNGGQRYRAGIQFLAQP